MEAENPKIKVPVDLVAGESLCSHKCYLLDVLKGADERVFLGTDFIQDVPGLMYVPKHSFAYIIYLASGFNRYILREHKHLGPHSTY